MIQTMRRVLRLWKRSWVCRTGLRLGREARNAFFASFLYRIWVWFDRNIVQSRPVQLILDPNYLTDAYYSSSFYQNAARWVRRLSFLTPKPYLPWSSAAVWLFLGVVLVLPQGSVSGGIFAGLFAVLAIFFFAHHSTGRIGVVFAMVILVLLLFWGALFLILPAAAVFALGYLLLGIGFFFLVSFAVRTREDFVLALRSIYGILLILCTVGVLGEETVMFESGVAFGEVLILLFPFAFLAPLTFGNKFRKVFYLGLLLMMTFTVVTETLSRAVLIGFSVELLLLILLIDFRYLPLLLFLAPAMTSAAVENIVAMWSVPKTHGNFFMNLFYAFRAFWQNGFGIRQGTLLHYYSDNALNATRKVGSVYFSMVLELGMLGLVVFLVYILRLAHGTFTSVFTAPSKYRPYFAAGFAMLAGISVSALFEASLFSPATLLTYWGMLGLLRAVRIIRFGIY